MSCGLLVVCLEGQLVDFAVVEAAGSVGAARARAAGGRTAGRRAGEGALGLLALVEAHHGVRRDLERDALLAVLGLVLAGPEPAVDEHAIALAEVLRGALGAIAPDAHPEPVRGFDPLAGLLVLGGLVDGHAELGDGAPIGR